MTAEARRARQDLAQLTGWTLQERQEGFSLSREQGLAMQVAMRLLQLAPLVVAPLSFVFEGEDWVAAPMMTAGLLTAFASVRLGVARAEARAFPRVHELLVFSRAGPGGQEWQLALNGKRYPLAALEGVVIARAFVPHRKRPDPPWDYSAALLFKNAAYQLELDSQEQTTSLVAALNATLGRPAFLQRCQIPGASTDWVVGPLFTLPLLGLVVSVAFIAGAGAGSTLETFGAALVLVVAGVALEVTGGYTTYPSRADVREWFEVGEEFPT